MTEMALARKIIKSRTGNKYRSARELETNLLAEIAACEQRAHQCGMLVTAHSLNRAKNALGWEMQGNVLEAGRASRDERPGANAPMTPAEGDARQ